MATLRRPLYYTGNADCPTSTFGPDDCIFGSNLPPDLPRPWSGTAAYTIGDTVFYRGEIWITRAAIDEPTSGTPNAAPSISRDSVWEHVAASLTRLTGSDNRAISTSGDAGFHEIRFAVNEGASSASIQVSGDGTVSGANDAVITLNLPSGGGGGAVSSVTAGEGLDATAATGDVTLSIERSLTKASLFLGARIDDSFDVEVTLAGAVRTAMAFTTANINDGLPMYFIAGVQLSGSRFIEGQGVWTSALDPSVDTLDSTNTFNLIG